MSSFPRVTFGIIVLNGEPFTRYCLRSLYPFAHEIIVVEGGHEDARAVCTADGHSIDGTLEALYRFKREEDPEDKLQIVTRDGFWPKRDELGRDRTHQSRAYAERATGDYLWQVDIDEFYRPQDMRTVLTILQADPFVTAVSFKSLTFWGDPGYLVGSWALQRGADQYHRLFRWGRGFRYVTHEPPTVQDELGRDLRSLRWINGRQMARKGVHLYHYSLLFPWQVRQKTRIYQGEKPESCSEIVEWAERNYFRIENPYRVHNLYRYPSWLQRYPGAHPPEVENMLDDIRSGRLAAEMRPMGDVENLLSSNRYRLGRSALKAWEPVDRLSRYGGLGLVRCAHIPGRLLRTAGARMSGRS